MSDPWETPDDPWAPKDPWDLPADKAGDFESKAPDEPKSDSDRWSDLLGKAKALAYGAGEGALSNFAAEAAGVGGAVGEKLGALTGSVPDRPFMDSYREARDFAQNEYDASRKEHPYLFGAGNVMGALGQVGGLGKLGVTLAARGGKAVAQGAALGGLAGLGGSKADLTKGEVGQAALDTGVGAGVGAAAGWLAPKVSDAAGRFLKNPIAKTKETVGQAMQVPQKAYEGVAERVGRTGIAQRTSGASDVSGPLASEQVKGLRMFRDSAEMGSDLAQSLRQATESLGSDGGKLVSAMTPEERNKVAGAMAELLQKRGLTDVTPEFVAQNMDSLAQAAGLELQDLTGNTFLRMANKRDPKWWVNAGEGVRKFWTSKLLAGEQLDPRLAQEMGLNREVADSMAKGEIDRMGRPFVEGGKPGRYQFGISEMEGKLGGGNPQQEALRRLQDRAVGRQAVNPDNIPTNPGARLNGIRRPVPATPDQVFADAQADVRDHLIAQGRNPNAPGKTIDELFPTLGPAAQQRAQAEAAQARLRNIATGRNFLQQRALPLAGAIAGGGSGAGLGILGMLSGTSLGAAGASKAPMVADALGEIGQSLAGSARDQIRTSALKAMNNPQKLQRLADVPGVVGSYARQLLESAKDPAAFAARSYVISQRPEFRAALAGVDDGQAQ